MACGCAASRRGVCPSVMVTRGLERGGRAAGMVVKGLEVCGKWVVGWERSGLTRRTRSRSGGVHCKCVMVARGLLLIGRQVGMCVRKISLCWYAHPPCLSRALYAFFTPFMCSSASPSHRYPLHKTFTPFQRVITKYNHNVCWHDGTP